MTDQESLNQRLAPAENEIVGISRKGYPTPDQPTAQSSKVEHCALLGFTQWQVGGNNLFRPAGENRPTLPDAKARLKYLEWATLHEAMDTTDLERWIEDTDGLSVAHLRELVVAVFCLKQPYSEVLEWLKNLTIRPHGKDEFSSGRIGLGLATASQQNLSAQPM